MAVASPSRIRVTQIYSIWFSHCFPSQRISKMTVATLYFLSVDSVTHFPRELDQDDQVKCRQNSATSEVQNMTTIYR